MTKDKPQCGLILENKEGKILLQLRDDKKSIPYPNCWGTFGGQIEEGENPEEAIKREIIEELGYVLENPEYIGNFHFEKYDIFMFRKVDFNISIDDLDVKEGQKGEFMSCENLNNLKYAFNCKKIVGKYMEKYHNIIILK